jgi:plasmid stability protein
MEVNLSIKGVPADIAERLRQRAERNHRSLQGELMAIIEQAVKSAQEPATGGAVPRQYAGSGTPPRKSIEQIAAEHRLRHPRPFRDLPLAVDIIRKDRDSR